MSVRTHNLGSNGKGVAIFVKTHDGSVRIYQLGSKGRVEIYLSTAQVSDLREVLA